MNRDVARNPLDGASNGFLASGDRTVVTPARAGPMSCIYAGPCDVVAGDLPHRLHQFRHPRPISGLCVPVFLTGAKLAPIKPQPAD
jgi:hypothetical protein